MELGLEVELYVDAVETSRRLPPSSLRVVTSERRDDGIDAVTPTRVVRIADEALASSITATARGAVFEISDDAVALWTELAASRAGSQSIGSTDEQVPGGGVTTATFTLCGASLVITHTTDETDET